MAFLPFIGPVFGVIDSVIKRILPERMSEEEKAKLSQELQLELMRADWNSVEKEYQDRADARALAMKESEKGNAFTSVLSLTVRPIWGYASLIVVAYPYLAGSLGWPAVAIDENTRSIVQTVIMFYFGGKTAESIIGNRFHK